MAPGEAEQPGGLWVSGVWLGLFEASDELLVVGLDLRFVGIRVVAGERDDLSIVFDCQFGVAADLVDQTETGVSVVDAREASQQVVGGLFSFVAALRFVRHRQPGRQYRIGPAAPRPTRPSPVERRERRRRK